MTFIRNVLRFYSAQSGKTRTPMIKFRKGATTSSKTGSTPGGGGAGHGSAKSGAQQSVILTELPARFQRQPISEEEIEYINRGGPA